MQGSSQIYIVMPIVIVPILAILIALPFLGAREPRDGARSGGQGHGQLPGAPAAGRPSVAQAHEPPRADPGDSPAELT